MQEQLEHNSSSVQWMVSSITGAMLKGKTDLGRRHTSGQESGGAAEMVVFLDCCCLDTSANKPWFSEC